VKRLLFLSAILFFAACSNPGAQQDEPNPEAVALNDSAVLLARNFDSTQIEAAIGLWQKALALQPGFYAARWNKMIFENHLGRREATYESLQQLEALRPESGDVKAMTAIFLELNGDSLQAREKFIEAYKSYKKQLNVLAPSTRDFQNLLITYAVNLKFLGLEQDANNLLEEIKNRPGNEDIRDLAENFQLKTRADLMRQFSLDEQINRLR